MKIQIILCLLHDKTILDKAPSHTPMGKPDNGEDLAGEKAFQAQTRTINRPIPLCE